MDIAAFQRACQGVVATAGDENFDELIHGSLWNRRLPDRAPQVVVRVEDERDVGAAIRFARANGLKVVVRGGGHNWCQPTLRDGGLLIDLARLNRVLSVDPEARRAVVQPIVSNRDAQKILNAHGLAFPSGHCPQVKLSGYLLGGGMSWNQGVWGHGSDSVEAIEVVTADGELITASRDENADYFWAARGAGSGFFGVVTRYHLRLHPLPAAMHACHFYYPLDEAEQVAAWLGELAPRLAPSVELSLFLLEAPPELRDRAAAQGGKVCLVTATSFAESEAQALAELQPLGEGPLFGKHLARSPAAPVTFEELFDASGALWPEGLRNRVQAIFSNDRGGAVVGTVSGHFRTAPSPISLLLFVFFTGPNVPAALPDSAFSMSARIYGGPWTMWKETADDEANAGWHREIVDRLAPFVAGFYIGESDTVAEAATARGAFSPGNWDRLAHLRAQYDPDGIFFAYSDGLNQ